MTVPLPDYGPCPTEQTCGACSRVQSEVGKTPIRHLSRDAAYPGKWCDKCFTRWRRHGGVTITTFCEIKDCTVCGEPATKSGLCNRHYLRARRHGDPLGGARERNGWEELVALSDHGLIWIGGTKGEPYGRYNDLYAHRIVYEHLVGPIPPGYHLDHRPECPKVCVTPEHLTPLTPSEHSLLGWERGELFSRWDVPA